MNAAEVIMEAQAVGIQIWIDGDDVVLNAEAKPSPGILELLSRNKPAILNWLRPGADGWSAKDWRNYFDRYANVTEFNRGLPRVQAEARALSCCIGEWLERNPIRSPPGRCDLCGESNDLLLPFLTGSSLENPGHTWLHDKCSRVWHQKRRATAVSALLAMGIRACVAPGSLAGG
jgi:hypothetical protein